LKEKGDQGLNEPESESSVTLDPALEIDSRAEPVKGLMVELRIDMDAVREILKARILGLETSPFGTPDKESGTASSSIQTRARSNKNRNRTL